MLLDFFSLFYPSLCLSCGNNLLKGEKVICTYCHYHLPKTGFHYENDNPVARHFWGKINIHSASAYFFFNKGEKVQHLIHRLKYKGRKEIGIYIGEQYGHELMQSPLFSTVDVIVPVPLHPARKRKRGYNQSEMFAEGLSRSMKKEHVKTALFRAKSTGTQTKKSRFARWENVNTVFQLNEQENLSGKHILLTDDVITTGSTLEASAQTLLKIPDVKISIATIAYSTH